MFAAPCLINTLPLESTKNPVDVSPISATLAKLPILKLEAPAVLIVISSPICIPDELIVT